MHICPSGHEIHSAADRDGQGHCLRCRHDWNVGYRSRQSAAMELARPLENHGIEVTRSNPPVDLDMLAALANGYESKPE
jgi:hypothetical protein